MHILEAALVNALADAARTRSENALRRAEEPDCTPASEPTAAAPIKGQAAGTWQTVWRRWLSRARDRPQVRA